MNSRELVATTAEVALAVDCGGKIIAWNQAAEHHLGYRSAEVLGRCCWRVLRGLDSSSNRYCDRTCPIRNMALKGEPIHRTQMFLRDASGATTRVSMSTVVVPGQTGKEIVHVLQRLPAGAHEPALAWLSGSEKNNSNARLSPRQLEVLKHLADGKGTLEIAGLLCIAPATVRHHVQHILTRLKVHNRLEAVALARRIGLA